MQFEYWLYEHSPICVQDALVSLRGLGFRYRRASDRSITAHFAFLLQSEKWNEEQFRDYQLARLRRVLQAGFRDVPFYQEMQRQLGCSPQDFRCVEDIRRLPLLDKSAVRGNEDCFLNRQFQKSRLSAGFTSGTTGTPLQLFETRESFSKRWAFVCRLRSWAGLPDALHPRRAQFTGRNIVPTRQVAGRRVYWRRNLPDRSLLFSTTHLSTATASAYAARLRRYNPDLVDGYPSALLVLARLSQSGGLELCHPKAIITSAETLTDDDRSELEQAFGSRVFNQYAASEPSCFWCDCEYGVMHISPEYGISELLRPDGSPAAPGEEGEVVVTSFLNPAMPLIRYRLGDTAVAGPAGQCECGRRMPRIQRVVGRTDDLIFVPERGYVGRLDPVFKELHGIVEAQIVQESADRLKVLLVPDARFDKRLQALLVHNLRAKVGEKISIEVKTVERIPRGPNGKFRAVVSRIEKKDHGEALL